MAYAVGDRGGATALRFMRDLRARVSGLVQITTDGLGKYPAAVVRAFGPNADHAVLMKDPERPASRTTAVNGQPDLDEASTSLVERQNLTMRMSMRRYTRKTNGFSKKIENHVHMLSLYFLHYNIPRVHQTLRDTPAMEVGLVDELYDLGWFLDQLEAAERAGTLAKISAPN